MKMRDCLILFALVSGFPVDLRPAPSETTTTTVGCFYKGRWYAPGENIAYGQTGNFCSRLYCDNDGHMVYADDWNCNTITETTPIHIQTTPEGCLYKGNLYQRGTEISHTETEYICSHTFCDISGNVIIWDDFGCQKTHTSSQSCFANGQWYAPREEISQWRTENYCYRKFCDPSGEIREEKDWNCTTTMTPASTSVVHPIVEQ